jgi:hypothetical protein
LGIVTPSRDPGVFGIIYLPAAGVHKRNRDFPDSLLQALFPARVSGIYGISLSSMINREFGRVIEKLLNSWLYYLKKWDDP